MLRCCFDSQGNLDNYEFNQLVEKLSGMLAAATKKYYLPGGDRDDLYQWGLMGLFKAVLHYDEDDRYTFEFVASRNIQNMMKSAVTMANREKHKLANEAESLCAKNAQVDNSVELIDRLVKSCNTYDPQEVVVNKESAAEVYHYIRSDLSNHERMSILLYIQGYKQKDICRKLNINARVVDNAIQRAKKKIHQYFVRENTMRNFENQVCAMGRVSC